MFSQLYTSLRVKRLFLLLGFNDTWKFQDRLSKNTEISTFMKICSVRVELFHAD